MSTLNQTELLRYQRHFPLIGLAGQEALKHANVLCIGAGGLGCPALQYLAAAGVGTLGIMDADHIEQSNLQRQILFNERDIGRNKATVAAERLQALNSQITVHAYNEFLSQHNAQHSIQNYDVIIDATDNYEARYLLNETCRTLNKPWISASIYQFNAQLSVFNYKNGPCYQCLYPEPPPAALTPNCAIGGVLGALPGVVGAMQATEAIKIILNQGLVLSGKLLCVDLLSMRFNQFEINKHDCANHPVVTFTKRQATEIKYSTINAVQLSKLLNDHNSEVQLIDVRQPFEREICHIGGEFVPLSQLKAHVDHFNKEKPIIVYCKSGARSSQACQQLLEAGFKQVSHLEGGILAWITTIDGNLMKY